MFDWERYAAVYGKLIHSGMSFRPEEEKFSKERERKENKRCKVIQHKEVRSTKKLLHSAGMIKMKVCLSKYGMRLPKGNNRN